LPYTDPEKRREARRKYRADHPEKIREQKKRARDRKRGKGPRVPLTANERQRKAKYRKSGWTLEMFDITMAEQGNLCALCREPFTEKNPACADHKHCTPPEPRGLIHSTCNAALGMLKDSPELCRAAAEYLEAWS